MTTFATATTPARWLDLIGAECIKLRSLRSTPVVLGLLVPFYVWFAHDSAAVTHDAWPTMSASERQEFDPAHGAFRFPLFLLLMATAGTIGAMTVAGEYASGLIRTTFIAVPARGRVLAAKAVVVTGVLALLGLLVGVGVWAATFVAYGDRITAFSAGTPGVGRSVAGTTAMVAVCGLIGMAIASIIRNTAGSVFAVLVFFLLGPVVAKGRIPLLGAEHSAHVVNAMPAYAWGRLTVMNTSHVVERIPSVTAAWSALAGWALVAIAVQLLLRRRDV
ncbi:ABC transporter permease (plasmid) [Embleya sp. NBC_00888]|uniref:ABC transporter permease n=1 Tax=Embleya sp. NBC_00888 TaxID=2975960 RepID=UPI002F9066A2|nr:ABC transporter permease [Embleya sp. NBC_00888]